VVEVLAEGPLSDHGGEVAVGGADQAHVDALGGRLLPKGEIVYVAVTPPAPNDVLVQVYLVGRATCRDLVGLASISVET
jgi:hypothetical protein